MAAPARLASLVALGAVAVACAGETFLVGEDHRPALPGAGGGAGGSGAGTAGGATASDPCAALRCAPGRCVIDAGVGPRCACPLGFLRDHARCVPCQTLSGGEPVLALERPTAPVQLTLFGGGVPLVDGAAVNLLEVETGIALTLEPGRLAHVPVGRYQASYEGRADPASAAPANRAHPLGLVEIAATQAAPASPHALVFDLPVTRVVGELVFSQSHDQLARLLHLDLIRGASVASARFTDESRRRFETLLVDGDYELVLAGSGDGDPVLPLARRVEARAGHIDVGRIEVPVGVVEARLRLPPGSEDYATTLYLRGPGGLFRMDALDAGRFVGAVPHGAYDLIRAPVLGAGAIGPVRADPPVLARVHVRDPVVALAPLALPLVRTSGRVLVDQRVPDGAVQSIQLRSAERGAVALRLDPAGRYSAWIEPGSYQAHYACSHPSCRDGRVWPANREAVLGEVEVGGGAGHDILVPVADVEIEVTERWLPGAGSIGLWDATPGAGRWSSSAYVEGSGPRLALRLVQGRYAVVYQRTGRGVLNWRLGLLAAQGDRIAASWNVPTVRVRGTLSLGPEAALRRFRLENLDRGYVGFETDARGRFEVDVPIGQYLLRVGPGQVESALGCFAFDGAPPGGP